MSDVRELTRTLEELDRRKRESALSYYSPYPKQREFHALGSQKRERMLSAGNQCGKTFCGAAEMAMHLSGAYPEWWEGRRFTNRVTAWAAGVTSEATRDTLQKLLLGPPGGETGGLIPKASIVSTTLGRGINGAVDTVLVRHASGNLSELSFKAFEKGREKFQGASLEIVWLDEEAPADVYSEALARITARQGIVYTTFTPLLGMSGVVNRFFSERHADRALVQMSIEDAEHISIADRQRVADGYQEFERDARLRGIPMLGSGRVFPIAESVFTTPGFSIPTHWPRIAGLDLGWDHPTACAWLAWDRDSDTVYVYDSYRSRQETVAVHASAIKLKGDVPVSWPHDAMQADRSSGDSIAAIYRNLGVRMLPERATFPDGGNSVEAGIADMFDRMSTGRLKVFAHLTDFFEEFRTYHRKDGRLVKERDDLLSATRYALMMLREARTPDRMARRGAHVGRVGAPRMASDIDYNLFDHEESRMSRREAEDRHRAMTFRFN